MVGRIGIVVKCAMQDRAGRHGRGKEQLRRHEQADNCPRNPKELVRP